MARKVIYEQLLTLILQVGQVESMSSQAVSVSMKSVAKIENNYIYKTGSGISVQNSDVVCQRNHIYSCSRRYSHQQTSSSLGLFSGVNIRGAGSAGAKLSVSDNLIKQCDVAIHVADHSGPAIRYSDDDDEDDDDEQRLNDS